jgi:hypothetical protein
MIANEFAIAMLGLNALHHFEQGTMLRGRPKVSSAKPDVPIGNRLLVAEKEFLEGPLIWYQIRKVRNGMMCLFLKK